MPIIALTNADRMASLVIPTAWYKAEIVEIDGPKVSSSEKSFNFFIKIQITDGEFTSKELSIVFNTKTKSPSVLGTQQFFPTAWFFPLAAAIQNIPTDQVNNNLDTDTLIRKPFDIKVEKGIHEGIPMNTILTFLPAGQGKDQTVPF